MKIGYARVSTDDQNLDLQIDALEKYGCDRIFQDRGVSGSKKERPGLSEAMSHLRAGDTLVVWKMDRFGRSLSHLIRSVEELKERGVEFASIVDAFDTSTAGGRFFFHIMAAVAEFERDIIRERTKAGLESARARGKSGGRPKSLNDAQIRRCKELSKNKDLTVAEICKMVDCSRSAYYRAIAH